MGYAMQDLRSCRIDLTSTTIIGLTMRLSTKCFLATVVGAVATLSGVQAAPLQVPLHPITLPITFGPQFQDSARRQQAASDFGAGLPGFDKAGSAYFRSGDRLVVRRRLGGSEIIDFKTAMTAAINTMMAPAVWDGRWEDGPFVDRKIAFDDNDFAYTVVTPRYSNLKNSVLLFSLDKARTWKAYTLTGISAVVEGRDAFNDLSSPPAVLSFDTYGSQSGTRLWLHVFRLDSIEGLSRERDELVSDQSLLSPNHSGGANSAVSTRGKIVIAFPSSTPPASGGVGTEIMLRQYDRGKAAFEGTIVSAGTAGDLTRLPTTANAHHIPGLTVDKRGKLYLFYGAHQGLLKYAVSKTPANIFGGWTDAVPFGNPLGPVYGSYTYISVTMDLNQRIHVFTRYAGDRYEFQLVHMVKPYGQRFKTYAAQAHQVVIDPNRTMYAAYRQQSTIDRSGNVYVYFEYWPNQLTDAEAGVLDVVSEPRIDCRVGRCFYLYRRHLFPTTLVYRAGGDIASLYAAGH